MRICIDAGHNYSGHNTGAAGNGLKEQDITFYIADRLNKLLQAAGVEALMTRPALGTNLGTSNNTSLSARYSMANGFNADLFISIHCNAGGGTGTETLIYGSGGTAEKIAGAVQARIVERLGLRNRGVKVRPDLAVLKNTTMPAILIETAFIDSTLDAELLRSNQQGFAQAIYDGLAEYYGLEETNMSRFTDVPDDHWAKDRIEQMADLGLIKGFEDGSYKPNQPMSRAEMAVVFGRNNDSIEKRFDSLAKENEALRKEIEAIRKEFG